MMTVIITNTPPTVQPMTNRVCLLAASAPENKNNPNLKFLNIKKGYNISLSYVLFDCITTSKLVDIKLASSGNM